MSLSQRTQGDDGEKTQAEETLPAEESAAKEPEVVNYDPEMGSLYDLTARHGKPCIVLYTESWCNIAMDMLRMIREASEAQEFSQYAFVHVDLNSPACFRKANEAGASGPYCTQLWREGQLTRTSYNRIRTCGYLQIFLGG